MAGEGGASLEKGRESPWELGGRRGVEGRGRREWECSVCDWEGEAGP